MAGRIEIEGEDAAADPDAVRAALSAVLSGEGIDYAELTVIFVNDEKIKILNNRFLGHDYPTDVISFPISDPGEGLEGEIYISVETVKRNAAEYGATPAIETLRIAIHGLLHLLGYDDADGAGRSKMRDTEERYLDEISASA